MKAGHASPPRTALRAHRRLVRLQRQIHVNVRADVRRALGPQSRSLLRYYDAYKREFRGHFQASSKQELLLEAVQAQIVLMGDYHTFAQSQKAALRLLGEVRELGLPLVLGLEMIPSSRQFVLDAYLAGKIDEKEFLKKTDYQARWGFPWENFRPLLDFAKAAGISVVALNSEHENLLKRDAHAAALIAAVTARRPDARVFVLYGDLHLARGHIPRFLARELRARRVNRRVLTVFQNSETLYWRLAARRMEDTVEVLRLGDGRYCIMNAAPWVKLQSYLQWSEAGALLDPDDAAGGLDLQDHASRCLGNLTEALGLELPPGTDFSVRTVSDLGFLSASGPLSRLARKELRAVRHHVLGSRTIFVPGNNVIYLPSTSVNSFCEGVARFAHGAISGARGLYSSPSKDFFAATLSSALAYFGSKVLNHKRKCDLEEDFRLLLRRRIGARALPREALQRRVARAVLRACRAQRDYLKTGRYRHTLDLPRGGTRVPFFLETTRCLGFLLGEKLYAGFVQDRLRPGRISEVFRAPLDDARLARKLYLELTAEVEPAWLAHSSKTELF